MTFIHTQNINDHNDDHNDSSSYSNDSYIRLSTLHKEFEIYGIVSKREELIELYNSSCKEINYVNAEMLYESNVDLPKDKVFHGILLLGKNEKEKN